MATIIDKKDTADLASTIADNIKSFIAHQQIEIPTQRQLSMLIEEGLNDWISECETEDAEYRKGEMDSTLGTGEMVDGDY